MSWGREGEGENVGGGAMREGEGEKVCGGGGAMRERKLWIRFKEMVIRKSLLATQTR